MDGHRNGRLRAWVLMAVMAIGAGLGAAAQKGAAQGLRAVEADSVVLCDFFWCGAQREIDKALGCEERAWPWRVEPLKRKKLDKRVAAWDERLKNLDLWGLEREKGHGTDAVKSQLRESVELGLLTGQARFFDLAERLLANAAMKHWRGSKEGTADRELAEALRAVGSVAYAVGGRDIFVNMPLRSNVHLQSDSVDLYAQVVCSGPWYNDMSLRIVRDMSLMDATTDTVLSDYTRVIFHEEYGGDSVEARFHFRVPSWIGSGEVLPSYTAGGKRGRLQILVNGTPARAEMKDGYAVVSGRWTVGDLITVSIPTPILRIADKNDPGRVALQRGPLLYCSLNKAEGWSLDLRKPIKHDFDHRIEAIVLSGELRNEQGTKPFQAFPAYLYGGMDKIFMPAE